jgi:BirA family biotin operon repressor/biotin-[acetyl-CoA-carboxylase] ligase
MTMDLTWRLARRLGDGRFRSGVTLAGELGVSRATIWNASQRLRELGFDVQSVRGRGYRLADPVDWLDVERIRQGMESEADRLIAAIEVHEQIDSTNARLLLAGPPPQARAMACLAEFQDSGRGRRGRRWVSPPGTGVCLSVAWQFDRQPPKFGALGLVAGLAVREALKELGVAAVMIKWPNDLVVANLKLGGVLVEMRAEGNGPALAVVGVGINYRLSERADSEIRESGGLPATDLAVACGDTILPGRNTVASAILSALVTALDRFGREGPGDLVAAWRDADALVGRQVAVELGKERVTGRALGIDADGSLRVERDGGTMRVTAGDVSVRTET